MSTESNWRSTILEALEERDKVEKKDVNLYSSFEALYDRVSQAEDALAKLHGTDVQSELQASLTENQQLKTQLKELDDKNKELETLISKNKAERTKSNKEISMLNKAVTRLTSKLNTQTEEYQHKNKSIELVNDEILALSIQNNLLTDKVDKLEKENGELVERWIEKVRLDADKMNEANAFLEMYGSKNSNQSSSQ